MFRLLRRRPQHKIRKRSRTIPMPGISGIGYGQDDDHWFRCWHCGFPCSEDREALSGPEQYHEVEKIDYIIESYPEVGKELSATMTVDNSHNVVLMELGADGVTPKGINEDIMPNVQSGCPFCGTLNWRGDY